MASTPAPRRSDTRSSLVRDGARKALHNFTNLKRRMSSNIGTKSHGSGQSPGPGPGKRAKMVVSKTVDKVLGWSSSTSPKSSEPRSITPDLSHPHPLYNHPYPQSQLQQHPPNPPPVLGSQILANQSVFAAEYYGANDTIQQYNAHQQLDDSLIWPNPIMLECEPAATMADVSVAQTQNITMPCINTNVDADYWQEHPATTSMARILGRASITPQPNHAIVEGPIHDLNQLDRSSTLRGTHRDRYTRTVSAVHGLSAAVTSCGSPTNAHDTSLPTSRQTAPLPCRNGSIASTGAKPCPWPGCTGTRGTNSFESNRLKEHLRRNHLYPYMCDTPGCVLRKGDKNQITRHRKKHHPHEDPKQYKDQTNDPFAAKQLKMLSERAISYERIVRICQAKSIEELDEAWGDVHAYQSPAVGRGAQSVPVSPTSMPAPGASISGARAGPSGPPNITVVDGSPGHSSTAGLLPAARIGPGVDTTDPIKEFVTNVLVPHVESLNLNTSPSPSRASRDEHLQRVLDLIAISAKRELDQQERRRSSGAISNAPSYGFPSYTEMVTSGAQICASATAGGTPALTNDKSLTAHSSYGSLNPPPMGGFPSLPMVPNQKQFEQPWAMSAVPQQQLAPSQVQRPNLNAFDANDGPESKWMDEFITRYPQ